MPRVIFTAGMRAAGDRNNRKRAGRISRTRFYLAFAYLLWSIVPHFHLLVHSHAGGAHTHAALSGAQVRLANQVLEGLGPAVLSQTAETDFSGEETDDAEKPLIDLPGESGLSGLAGGSGHPVTEAILAAASAGMRHAHFWEDANLAGAVPLPAFAGLCAAFFFHAAFRYAAPSLKARAQSPARGPPALLFA